MSAEKELVNFWLNRKGYFTVSNIKHSNKDIGLIAYKHGADADCMHVEIACSLTSSEQDPAIAQRFQDKEIKAIVAHYANDTAVPIKNVIVLNAMTPHIIARLHKQNVLPISLSEIMKDVMTSLKTEFFKNETLRTMQLMKYVMLAEPAIAVDSIYETMLPSKRREFIRELLGRDDVIKEFKKTNEERLAKILKQSMIKPEKLAAMLENEVLSKRGRKQFAEQFNKEQKTEGKKDQHELPLISFFE